ncbi:MAG: hypothetical protein KBA46_05990 [Candidatus Omnitrophica bacterium]|nr:hypothetical protein [Candidatus Omnitrophota bacterium]
MSRNLVILLIFSLCLIASSAVFALSSFTGINALGKNPSRAPKIFTGMVVALFTTWALAVALMAGAFYFLAESA